MCLGPNAEIVINPDRTSTSFHVLVRSEGGVPASAHPHGSLPALDVAATYDSDTGRIHLSMVDRDRSKELSVRVSGVTIKNPKAVRLHHDEAGNRLKDPEGVVPADMALYASREFGLPPHSHTTLVGELA